MVEPNKFSLSVVVPNYNGAKLLSENLPSVVAACNAAFTDYEIIVSDDGSTDSSIDLLRSNFPNVRILTTEQNTGFSKAANRGINQASRTLCLLLNSDVTLTTTFFESQLPYFDKPDTFGVMSQILSPDSKTLIDGGKFPKLKFGYLNTTLNFEPKQKAAWLPTLFLSGANALVCTKKLKALGGFDEAYSPYYGEDVDLCVRAWRRGWRSYYDPNSACTHRPSSTIAQVAAKKSVAVIAKRNRHLFMYQHSSGGLRIKWSASVFLSLLTRWLVFDTLFYRSFFAFLKMDKAPPQSQPLSLSEVVQGIHRELLGVKKRLF